MSEYEAGAAADEPLSLPEDERRPGLVPLFRRFLLIYPIVFMLPFPLTILGLLSSIPGYAGSDVAEAIGWLIGLHGEATQPIVAWLGRLFTGEAPSFEFTGSGDGLASWLGVLLDLVVAAVIALAWWLPRRTAAISRGLADAGRVLLRYYVAWVMFSYGFSKVFPLQFSEMGPDRLIQPYGDSSPMGLLWTFMGASTGYQIFAGAGEVLGALLLLFRRTSLLGALVIAGVMANVFAMNVFFDVPVKLYSFHYLAFAILIALPDFRRLTGLFVTHAPVEPSDLRSFWSGSRFCRVVMGFVKLVLVIAILGTNIASRIERMQARDSSAAASELRGIYLVESFEASNAQSEEPAADDSVRWLRVGMNPPYVATVQFADGSATRMRLRVDPEASTLAIFDRSLLEPTSDPLRFERLDDDRIRLEGVFEDLSIQVTLRRDTEERLFTSRGFHWISEYPFNR